MSGILERKIESKVFKDYFNNLLEDICEKKVLIYGAGQAFEELQKRFDFKKLNIVAISDLKFTEEGTFNGYKSITPSAILQEDFDVILMTLIYPVNAVSYLRNKLRIDNEIKQTFDEIIPQENDFINYLEEINFKKHLDKFSKTLKNKKVVIYGTGIFFQAINAYYDLSKLNIIAVSDRKYSDHEENEELLGYKVCSPNEIKDLNPDYLLVATRFFINIIEDLEKNVLKKTKIKIRPLIKKPFLALLKEIWD